MLDESDSASRLGRLAADLGLGLTEVPSPPGTAPWERERRPMNPDKDHGMEITITFTNEERKALLVALTFGVPDEPHEPLESARRKLSDPTTGQAGS